MQMDLLLKFMADARRSLEDSQVLGSQLRLDFTVHKGIAAGVDFSLSGSADRMVKERFYAIALKLGLVIRQTRPQCVDHACFRFDTDECLFYSAIMNWSGCRGEAIGDLYTRELADPIRAALGLLDLLEYELARKACVSESPAIGANDDGEPAPNDLISHVDAATLVGCSEQTIRARINEEKLRCFGATRRVSKAEVEAKRLSLRVRAHGRPKPPKAVRKGTDKQRGNNAMKSK